MPRGPAFIRADIAVSSLAEVKRDGDIGRET
jgi:hypothetical protein